MTDSKDLIARLREPSNWMKEGRANEDWNALRGVYDRAPFEAADRITALEAEVVRLREALEPFAQAAEIKLCGGDFWTNDKFIQNTDVAFHVRFGDLRRARAALEGQK